MTRTVVWATVDCITVLLLLTREKGQPAGTDIDADTHSDIDGDIETGTEVVVITIQPHRATLQQLSAVRKKIGDKMMSNWCGMRHTSAPSRRSAETAQRVAGSSWFVAWRPSQKIAPRRCHTAWLNTVCCTSHTSFVLRTVTLTVHVGRSTVVEEGYREEDFFLVERIAEASWMFESTHLHDW